MPRRREGEIVVAEPVGPVNAEHELRQVLGFPHAGSDRSPPTQSVCSATRVDPTHQGSAVSPAPSPREHAVRRPQWIQRRCGSSSSSSVKPRSCQASVHRNKPGWQGDPQTLGQSPNLDPDLLLSCSPNGIRTRAATLRGWCPRPLDDGAVQVAPAIYQSRRHGPTGRTTGPGNDRPGERRWPVLRDRPIA